jgi:lysozyme
MGTVTPNTVTTSMVGLKLIRDSEGCVLKAYPDPATGSDPWTIGYGHTGGVSPGDACTLQQAEEWLLDDVACCEDILKEWVETPLTQGMWDALVDFIFNLGPGQPGEKDGFVWLKSGRHSTLLNCLNEERYEAAAYEFPKWANPPLPGLVTRRAKERELFLSQGFPEVP